MKNRLTNDVRQIFHKVYEDMGAKTLDEKTGKPLTGHDAMLEWARMNPTEFYRLYGKMIPTTAELPPDVHEDFIDSLVLEDEQPKLIEATDITNKTNQTEATDVGEEDQDELLKRPDYPQIETDIPPPYKGNPIVP